MLRQRGWILEARKIYNDPRVQDPIYASGKKELELIVKIRKIDDISDLRKLVSQVRKKGMEEAAKEWHQKEYELR
jgi:hypothetical protein